MFLLPPSFSSSLPPIILLFSLFWFGKGEWEEKSKLEKEKDDILTKERWNNKPHNSDGTMEETMQKRIKWLSIYES